LRLPKDIILFFAIWIRNHYHHPARQLRRRVYHNDSTAILGLILMKGTHLFRSFAGTTSFVFWPKNVFKLGWRRWRFRSGSVCLSRNTDGEAMIWKGLKIQIFKSGKGKACGIKSLAFLSKRQELSQDTCLPT